MGVNFSTFGFGRVCLKEIQNTLLAYLEDIIGPEQEAINPDLKMLKKHIFDI